MSVTTINCPQCGTPLPSDAPKGLCPECLLRGGFESAGVTPSPGAATVVVDAAQVSTHARPVVGEDFGGYRLTRLLGGGGMGTVFEAEQRETGRRVAVKVMNQALASDTDRKRFLREGRLAASVSHPNVVYVFGSEEIDGTPMIVMELVTAGTLDQRVQRAGPLPVAEAVETLLQIIDGLEAAHAVGVLHRDLKPANCFVTPDGTVKVGDFGLSISTLARGESLLTARGTVLGTPAFASPEQLQGEELDVRTDIYAAGATLYYMLTGRAPFAADDLVKLIALVLSKPPLSAKSLRPDLPGALAKVVRRCLAKDRTERYASYEKLRQALQPFRSFAPTPGTLLARFAASVVDTAILMICLDGVGRTIGYASQGDLLGEIYRGTWPAAFFMLLMMILYFACCEGFWGATPGKRLCRLRVTNTLGHGIAFRSALFRSSCFHFPALLAPLLLIGFTSPASYLAGGPYHAGYWMQSALPLLLLVTMRKANGYAMLHDVLSGTRVISSQTPTPEKRMELRIEPNGEPVAVSGPAGRVGPYLVLETLWRRGAEQLSLGYDEALRRKVWIHHVPSGTPPVLPQRWELARAGRLRWLLGRRTATEGWDVYEAFDGQPLLRLADQPQPWGEVRLWLHDLAGEYSAVLRDDSPPPAIGLDRVWITGGRHALLLDFPCPGLELPLSPPVLDAPSFEAMQRFLNEVAECALGTGSDPSAASAVQAGHGPDSMDQCSPVSSVADTSPGSSGEITGSKATSPPRPAKKRFRLPLALHAETFLRSLRERKFDSLEMLLANLHSVLAGRASLPWWQSLLSQRTISDLLWILGWAFVVLWTPTDAGVYAVFLIILGLFFQLVSLLWSLVFGRPLLLSTLEVVVVTRNGRPASRPRMLTRALVAALPAWTGIMVWLIHRREAIPNRWMVLGVFVALYLPGVIVSLRKPHRSLPDRVAGTFVVPR